MTITFWTIAISILSAIALSVMVLQMRADYYLERAPDTEETYLRFTRVVKLYRRAIQAMYIYVTILFIIAVIDVAFLRTPT